MPLLTTCLSRRTALTTMIALLALPLAARYAPAQAAQPPATILLIRHAEKLTDGRMDLALDGFKRATLIPDLFGGPSAAAPHNLPRPDFLFATHQSAHSNRPYETILPLSSVLNLPIDDSFLEKDTAGLAKLLLSGKFAGKVVLVSWHHGTLPEIATALGVSPTPAKWPDTQFNHVWRIDYRGGKATLTDLPQGLMPGDSK